MRANSIFEILRRNFPLVPRSQTLGNQPSHPGQRWVAACHQAGGAGAASRGRGPDDSKESKNAEAVKAVTFLDARRSDAINISIAR